MKLFCRINLLGLLVFLANSLYSATAFAAFIVNTGINESPDANNWALNSGQWLAAEFTINQPYTITEIEGALSTSSGGQTINIVLYSDGGDIPGSVLFSKAANLVGSTEFPLHPNWQGISELRWSIASGSYWIAFEHVSGFLSVMPGPTPNQLLNEAFYNGSWIGNDDFGIGTRISAEPVPIPGAFVLFVSALITVVIRRCRRVSRSKQP
jgi:hypothetical protein